MRRRLRWAGSWAACALLGACAQEPAAAITAASAALRPDSPNTTELPPVYAASDRVERFDSSEAFRVHFTRSGVHAVPDDDADRDGTPDYVEEVAREYEAVRAFYKDELGFLEPLSDAQVAVDNGGDGRFDVYLLDFPTSADGSFRREQCLPDAAFRCTGYMLHENDFARRNYPSRARATRILASHEYFHAIQNAYDAEAGVVIGEATAVWGSETYDASLTDLEGFVSGYLAHTERSLAQEPIGPVDPFSYGASLFFQYLGERFDRGVIRALWQALLEAGGEADPVAWPGALDEVLRRDHASSLEQAFSEFTRWNLYTGTRADPAQGYASAAMYPEVTETELQLPLSDDSVRMFGLAARFYQAPVRAAGKLSLALVKQDSELAGLHIVLARESGGRIAALESADASESDSLSLSVERGDVIHAIVLNARMSGASLRPGLCLGDAKQVQACRRALGGQTDADAAAADGGETEQPDSGGGCSLLARPGAAAPGWPALLGAAVTCRAWCGLSRRRSRRLQLRLPAERSRPSGSA